MKRQRTQHGFTLLELLITIVVLVILITIAAPSFIDTLDRRRVINATQAMADQIQLARSTAILRNQEVSMLFSRTSGTDWCFGLTDDAVGNCNCNQIVLTANDACTITITTPQGGEERILAQSDSTNFNGVELGAITGNNRITFEPTRGIRTNPAGGNISYSFESPRGVRTRIDVNILGRVSICSPSSDSLLGGIKPCSTTP